MNREAVAAAIAVLDQARSAQRLIGKLSEAIAPATREDGAQLSRARAEAWHEVPPGGFKIGAIAKRMQEYLGIHSPVAGFMRAADILDGPADYPLAGLIDPGVECEIAVRLTHDLPARPCSIEEVRPAVSSFHSAIEIVEHRYEDLAAIGLPTLIADRFFHTACVLGPGLAEWRGLDLAALPGRLLVDGEWQGDGSSADLMGHPLAALAWLAGSAEVAAFGGLKAGQTVMLGSVIPSIHINGPAVVESSFPPLPTARLRLG